MAATGTTTTVLVDDEDTANAPQTQQFNSVSEFHEDEEDFIDVDVDYDENDRRILDDPPEDHDENRFMSVSDELFTDMHKDDGDDSHIEMAPLLATNTDDMNIINSSGLTPPSQRSTKSIHATPQMRIRRNIAGGTGEGDYDKNKPPRLSCLKRKKSREGTTDYENSYHHHDGGQYSSHMDASDQSAANSESSQSHVSGGHPPVHCVRARRHCVAIGRTTVSIMNFLARILLWGSFVAMVVAVVWYSRELKMNGTDPHLIAWFSAGAFVLLGFPISMCGIIMHLKNYYQPNVQCYVVRILWMVPIYSIESWLCLRFHELAIYIETLRDCYESYVLYSFFQFLIEVLGGEEALVLMLKDKSPTRGAHIWGLGYCMKPWVMGQPVSRRVSYTPDKMRQGGMGNFKPGGQSGPSSPMPTGPAIRPIKRVRWTSPFFVKCKFGVLQYVVLKFVLTIFVMVLELYGLYKEGDFTPRGGYLYICILTNLSQCWALYCLVFFYYALKNELGPIRPVGKFLSVKALVFFTWWQSLGISILFQMGMIPHYASFDNGREWTSEAVAKGLQDWLICIEMFCAAIIHSFVFPHTDYLEPLGIVEQRAGHQMTNGVRRLGRRGRHGYRRGDDRSASSKGSGGDTEYSGGLDLEIAPGDSTMPFQGGSGTQLYGGCSTVDESDKESTGSAMPNGENPRHKRQGFVRALLDSTLLPRDVLDESVGIFKGDFNVEKKTLLHHATTSDEYDLFSKSSKRRKGKFRTKGTGFQRKERSEAPAGVPDSIGIHDKD